MAKQEIHTATRNKAIIFSLVLILVGLVAACGVITWFQNRDSDDPSLVLVGIEATEFESLTDAQGIDLSTAASRAEAQEELNNAADAALIRSDEGWELLTDGEPDSSLSMAAEAAASTAAHNQALARVGISPEVYAQALPEGAVTYTNIDEQEKNFSAIFSTLIGISVAFYFIMLFAGNIGGRVTEEKSSRVIELILASARPLDFLTGKIVGNLIVGFINAIIVILVGAGALLVTGLAEDIQFEFSLLPIFVLTFVLGMLFFGGLWAAAGSMVSRAEDLASTQAPIMLLSIGSLYAAIFGMSSTDSTIMQVLGWLPPFSLTVAPMQYAAGNMNMAELLGSYAVMVLAIVAVLALTARIYRRSILHNGQKMTWRAALSRG
ncbi:ABC transporter permease [Corynebacterium lowii]|uniref:ABC transporter permease n=1 Tax=Corynebacterium lowii TaxID=1544413 RepID=UPI001FE031EE|nr:ABC transporter permease [Corynebacterium lowii]MDP9851743.1 ABC-2 type transport system permease protein [Corynebacterium lowii]